MDGDTHVWSIPLYAIFKMKEYVTYEMETDIVTGLELGADDYITKPFSLAVLRARVKTRIRDGRNQKDSIYQLARFFFNFQEMVFRVSGKEIEFSKTE